ncbi:unnamed protein product [Peronospora belbahrii]|uniref:Uncharacterized protein n=1 Tax=Peronospora belbahrii TaxID=622444 RepID=A0AAU9KIU2_9STRA|nr:unnamed protein product [Peronospora belbahrii]CAH0517728.1 unnamed protein product [Peronospora belbahrii]
MLKWLKLLTTCTINLTVTDAKTTVVIGPVGPLTPTVATSSASSAERDYTDIDDGDISYLSYRGTLSLSETGSDDDDNTSSLNSNTLSTVPFPTDLKIGSTVNTKDKVVSTYRNWVGPSIGKPSDPAGDKGCWRKAYIMSECPYGFDYTLGTCWAQCPMAYPVKCGFECIRQSDNCGSEIYAKFVSVANAFMSIQIGGFFGEFAKLSRTVRVGIKCARAMLGTMRAIVNYVRAIHVSNPQTSLDHVLLALYQTSYITIDLPVSIVMCMGKPYNDAVLDPASVLMGTVQVLVGEILARQDIILSSWEHFKDTLLHLNFTDAVNDLNETEISSLKTGMESNSMCGYELQRLTDRAWRTIAEMKEANPGISEDDLRVAVYKSDLMLNDIPTVTNNCMEQMIMESDEATAYKTRDTLRKTYGVIVNDLIEKGKSDDGASLTAKEYTRVVADKLSMGIATVFYIDLTRISGLLSEYIEIMCGPTQFIGEIDDGSDPETLGLRAVGDVFKGSVMSWEREGDGIVRITFASADTEDVTVNVISGGNKFDEQDVRAGETVTYTTTVEALGGKTLYLDRWRPGFLGLPGTGGGSLKLWVPRASKGGHLQVNVTINVTE